MKGRSSLPGNTARIPTPLNSIGFKRRIGHIEDLEWELTPLKRTEHSRAKICIRTLEKTAKPKIVMFVSISDSNPCGCGLMIHWSH